MVLQKKTSKDTDSDRRYTETTNHITVSVYPEYLEHQSDPYNSVFTFAYTVLIENEGTEAVQLLRRHWVVYSGGDNFTEVRGDGVVGEQPVLRPGEQYQYTSGASIKDTFGSMMGTYTFLNTRGELFEVDIPEFDLASTLTIH